MANPSFENLISCPTTFDQLSLASDWDSLRNGGGTSPDILTSCTTSGSVKIPNNTFGFQYPRTGNNCAGQGVYVAAPYPETREYIQNKLSQKLISGHQYCVSWFLNLANCSKYSIDEFGAYFDNGSISASSGGAALVTPQIKSSIGQCLSDTLNWIGITGSFTANGIEEYLTLGNFKNNSQTNYTCFVYPTVTKVSYYFIDDVSVIDINTLAYAGNDTIITLGDSVFIGRLPEIGLNEDCIWFAKGSPIDTIAGLWVIPNSTTTYILQQTICGTIKYDTVTVVVADPNGFHKSRINSTEIFPNPSNGKFTIKGINNQSLQITISNLLGQIIYATQSSSYLTEIDLSKERKGIYFVTVKGTDFSRSIKVIVE